MLCSQKYNLNGLESVTWSVDQEFQNFSGWRTWRWNDSGRVRLRGGISWWGWLWETDATCQWVGQDRSQESPSQSQVDHLEGWLLEKPIPYISNDNFSQLDIFDYWNDRMSGSSHVKWTYPDVVRMWRQFHGCPGSGGGIEQVYQITDLWWWQKSLHRWWRHIQETQLSYGG